MKFAHRFVYYFGGFSLGIIILVFFLQGKKASCAYGPNARTTKNIATKPKLYSEEALAVMKEYDIDTLTVSNMIRYGDVNFSKSDARAIGCKTYIIDNTFKEKAFELNVKNCDTIVTIQSIVLKK